MDRQRRHFKVYCTQEVRRMDPRKTGEIIRRLRTEAGLTQQQLADRLHVGAKAVSKWETGVSQS